MRRDPFLWDWTLILRQLFHLMFEGADLEICIGRHGTINGHNEEVQKLDVIANNLLIQHLSGSGQFFALASEENDTPIYPTEGKDAHYIICFGIRW